MRPRRHSFEPSLGLSDCDKCEGPDLDGDSLSQARFCSHCIVLFVLVLRGFPLACAWSLQSLSRIAMVADIFIMSFEPIIFNDETRSYLAQP